MVSLGTLAGPSDHSDYADRTSWNSAGNSHEATQIGIVRRSA